MIPIPPPPPGVHRKTLRELIPSLSGILRELIGPRWPRVVAGLALVLIGRAAGLALPASTRYLVDDVILKRNIDLLLPLVIAVALASILQAGCAFLVSIVVTAEGSRLVAQLRCHVQQHVLRLPVNWFDSTKAGTLAFRIISEVEGTRHLMGFAVVELVGASVAAVLALIVLVSISPLLTAIAVSAIVLFSLVSRRILERIRLLFAEAAIAQSALMGRLVETLSGIRVVKGYHAEQRESAVFVKGSDRMMGVSIRGIKTMSLMGILIALVLGIVGAVIMYIAARQIIGGSLTLGGFMTFTALTSFLTGPMVELPAIGTQLLEALACLDRTQELLREKPENQNVRRTRDIGPLRGAVRFNHAGFAYEPGKPILHDLTFDAPQGTVTALVGSSGAGKSTIAGLILAFYDPAEGTVEVDGVDLTTVRLDTYRSQLGVVLQDTFLFDGTIRENVLFARPDATEKDMLQACRIAHVHEFAERLPSGYETVVGERGVKLSVGQRQRISIARAILADPKILILDEATSSLDSESEAAIQEGLSYLMANRTTFVIAHRLSTVQRADQILVIEHGRIVERGTHESLFAAKGRYFDLCTRQQGLVAPEAQPAAPPPPGDPGAGPPMVVIRAQGV